MEPLQTVYLVPATERMEEQTFFSRETAEKYAEEIGSQVFPIKMRLGTKEEVSFSPLEEMKVAERIYSPALPDVHPKIRAILVNWIILVRLKLKTSDEALYLAINLVDRFLSQRKVGQTRLQLVAISALLVASKYIETYPPLIETFRWISANAYSIRQIIRMESILVRQLGWELGVPTRYNFLREYLNLYLLDLEEVRLVRYVLDSTLFSYALTAYYPSEVVEAVLYSTVDVPIEANPKVVALILENLRYLREHREEFESLQTKYQDYSKTILEFLDSL